jgi:transglutaminase-like putative cysteine protease
MYDIRQFRPVLYLVVLVGITGFSMASESPGIWIFAVSLILTNAWLIRQKSFRPAPRLLTTAVSLLGFIYTLMEIRSRTGSPITAVGQFLVVLQIVKLWEQRANRDYAQLLVLSLLLMVSAAISTASLGFGILFIAYLLLSLYCCLLFHLKVEADDAKTAMSPTLKRWGESPLRQDQHNLSRSMRRLTSLVVCYAVVSAIVVFLLFPRNTGSGFFGQLQWRPEKAQTGFSEEVSFQSVARISQNDQAIGTVKVWSNGELVPFREPLLLRGATHDFYTGNDSKDQAPYEWTHARSITGESNQEFGKEMEGINGVYSPPLFGTARISHFRQEIQLNPTGTSVLFALAGVVSVKPDDVNNPRRLPLRFTQEDQTIRLSEPLQQPIRYEVQSSGLLGDEPTPPHVRSHIDPAITQFANQPQVTGGLAQRRATEVAARPDLGLDYVSPLDGQIAANIESYLKHNYKYTLDLTRVDRIKGRDPMVAFLYDFKKGHCEYFAGAMTLLCQSLGMDARLVIGFKCDDYNDYGHFYTIRQSQAHAWVEVLTTDGWKSYDPTSGNGDLLTPSATVWAKTKRLVDFLEYSWQSSVINYDSDNRESLIQNAETALNKSASRGTQTLNNFRAGMDSVGEALASKIVGPLIGVLSVGIFVAVGWYAAERIKLRRRAARIGIVDLPPSAQAKLMRQLGFYDDLLRLLESRRILRPPHLTPLEFCDSLSFLPTEAYITIHRITKLFYRIRYGNAELDEGQRRRLVNVIDRLSHLMPTTVISE